MQVFWRFSLLIAAIAVSISVSFASESLADSRHILDENYSAFYSSYVSARHDISEAGHSIDKLASFLLAEEVGSPDDMLERFAKSPEYQDFLSSFVLISDSRSMQRAGVSRDFPRMVLHQGRLFLGLTGDRGDKFGWDPQEQLKHRLFYSMEVIEYDAKKENYVFARIHFHPEEKGKDRIVVDRKDTACRNCHGKQEPRPIWASYNFWPGSYAGFDDRFGPDPEEAVAFGKFYSAVIDPKSPASHSRYRKLKFPDPVLRYNGLAGSPNHRLFSHLYTLNNKRIIRKLRDSAQFEKYQFALLGAFLSCKGSPIESFLPENVKVRHELTLMGQPQLKPRLAENPKLTVLDALFADSRENLKSEYSGRIALYNEMYAANYDESDFLDYSPDFSSPEVVAKLRYLVEGQGVSMKEWSLSFPPGKDTFSYSFGLAFDRIFTVYMLARDELIPSLRQKTELRSWINPYVRGTYSWSPHGQEALCEKLKSMSLDALGVSPSGRP